MGEVAHACALGSQHPVGTAGHAQGFPSPYPTQSGLFWKRGYGDLSLLSWEVNGKGAMPMARTGSAPPGTPSQVGAHGGGMTADCRLGLNPRRVSMTRPPCKLLRARLCGPTRAPSLPRHTCSPVTVACGSSPGIGPENTVWSRNDPGRGSGQPPWCSPPSCSLAWLQTSPTCPLHPDVTRSVYALPPLSSLSCCPV